jgi:hypothetical protein
LVCDSEGDAHSEIFADCPDFLIPLFEIEDNEEAEK